MLRRVSECGIRLVLLTKYYGVNSKMISTGMYTLYVVLQVLRVMKLGRVSRIRGYKVQFSYGLIKSIDQPTEDHVIHALYY